MGSSLGDGQDPLEFDRRICAIETISPTASCDSDGLGDQARQRDRPTLSPTPLPIVMRAGCVWEMLSFPHADHPSTTRTLPAHYPVSSGCFSAASRSNSSTAYSGPGSTAISSRVCIQIDPWQRLTRDGADRVAASRGAGAAD